MKIVEEYQMVKVIHLVDTNDDKKAENAVKKCLATAEQVSVYPETILTSEYKVRDLTDKDRSDYMIARTIQSLTSDTKEPEVITPKKRGRPRKEKT